MGNDSQKTYSAAQLREAIRGDLDQEVEALYPHAGMVPDVDAREHLNHLARVHEWADDEDLPDEFHETAAYQGIVPGEGTHMATDAVESGNVSQMQHVVGMVDSTTDDGQTAKQRMAKTLAREGAIVLVTGVPGSGKTAMTLDVVRIASVLENAHVIGNIGSWNVIRPPGTDRDECTDLVEDSEELGNRMGQIEGRVIGAIDEAAQALRQTGGNQQKAEKMAADLKLVRKKLPDRGDRYARRGSAAIIAHTLKGVGAEIRRVVDELWHKPSAKDPGRVEIYDVSNDGSSMEQIASYKGLTDTRESYNEHEGSTFDVPLDGDDRGDESGMQDADDVRREEHIKTAIKAVENDMSYRDAAELVPFSHKWVGTKYRDWRDLDEYTDLVPKEGDSPDGETD